MIQSSTSTYLQITLPVRKGITFGCTYNADGITAFFRFVYAVGSEPEA